MPAVDAALAPPHSPAVLARGLHTIGVKLTLAIALVIVLGFGAIVVFYTQQQERNILLQNERAIVQVLESVNQGLQTVMITASADAARLFADNLKRVAGMDQINILRPDGMEAFRDNATIHQVNEYRDSFDFKPRASEDAHRVFTPDDEHFALAVRSQELVHFYYRQHDEQHLSFLLPIKNLARCKRCHGRDKEILGVLDVRSELSDVRRQVRQTWVQSIAVLAVSVTAILLVVILMLRRYIVQPIALVSHAMAQVAAGDLDHRIPVPGDDELSSLATSFNALAEELRQRRAGFAAEHNKLATILMSADEGIVVTDDSERIVLVNPAAERLLDKPSARIIDEGLQQLLGDPAHMDAVLRRAGGARGSGIFPCGQRQLAVDASTLLRADGAMQGRAVLLRDRTEALRLERRLRELSNTDPLTGLPNRRALDETLRQECGLALDQGRELAVLMFDIDHFKHFNDTHGHDQGDRVLKAFAQAARSCLREDLDTLCRYGGEEFTLVARDTPQAGGMVLAERIRAKIEALRVDGLQVTTSIGVAGLRECAVGAPGELVERADAALYVAKRSGRNRVCAAGAAP